MWYTDIYQILYQAFLYVLIIRQEGHECLRLCISTFQVVEMYISKNSSQQ
jgi:hypothetical protein